MTNEALIQMAAETKMISQAQKKIQMREESREFWLKQQLKNSNYLNRLNVMYKNRSSFNGRDISPIVNRVSSEKDLDFQPEQGVNKVTTGLAEKQRKHND